MPFPIACPVCRAAFAIDEELFEHRVVGKGLRFRCPQCKERSAIDSVRKDAAARSEAQALPQLALSDLDLEDTEVAELSDDEVASLPPESIALAKAMRPRPRPRLESKVDDELWVVSVKEGVEDQEIFESSLIDLIGKGKMPPDAIVWREGIDNWIPLADVPELAKHLPAVTDDKTGGLFGTGMQVSFGSNAGERKSAPPPLPPKKRSYGSAKKKSYGGEGRAKPVALSPGFLFSVDDAESEPPQAVEEPRKGAKVVPKPPLKAPKRAVTRDLDFSDIAEEEVIPSSGAPALRDLTGLAKATESTAPAPPPFFSSLGGTEDEVLGPPSIDITDLGAPTVEPTAPAVGASPEAPESAAVVAPSSKKVKPGKSKRPPAPESEAARPANERASQPRAAATLDVSSPLPELPEERGWFTPARIVVLLAIAAAAYFLFSRQMQQSAPQALPAPSAPESPPLAAETPPPLESPEPSAAATAPEPTAAPEPIAAPAAPPPPGEPTPEPIEPPTRASGGTEKPAVGGTGATVPPPVKEEAPKAEPKAEPKPEPKPEPMPANPDAPPFNKDAAVAALNTAVAQAAGCRQEGDPNGTARVVVTFAPSGRVTSANLSGPPFAGTRTGGCIASTMRRAKIPAFSGTHVTVAKSVVIR